MPSGAAQAGCQGGGHLRQRHDDHCRSYRGREEIMAKIKVKDTEISIITVNNDDYISLTDMLKAKDGEFFISDWLRNRNTVEFLGVWERIYNPTFNYGEFAIIKSQAGLNSYKLSVKEWTEKTNALSDTRRTLMKNIIC